MARAAILALLCLLALPWPAAAAPDVSGLAFDPHPGAAVPLDGRFADAAGTSVTLRRLLDGRPAVLQLGYYTCPNLCGVTRDNLSHALDEAGLAAGRDLAVIQMSVNPTETVADAAGTRAALGAAAQRWHFLIGPAAPVARAVGFPWRPDDRDSQVLHPAGLVVLTPDGIVSGYLLGVGYSGAALRAAVREAAAAAVAPAPEPVFLICLHYDPATGTYSLDVTRALQIGGLLIVLAIGALLLRMRRNA